MTAAVHHLLSGKRKELTMVWFWQTWRSPRTWNGVAERAVYTGSIVLGRPEGIAVWLGYKAVIRWGDNHDKDRNRGADASAIFSVGTVVSLVFGILGGLIAVQRCCL